MFHLWLQNAMFVPNDVVKYCGFLTLTELPTNLSFQNFGFFMCAVGKSKNDAFFMWLCIYVWSFYM